MRLSARRRAGLALLGALAAVALLLAPVAAQALDEEPVEVDLDNAGCFGHHAAETPPFRTTVLLAPQPIVEVPAGQEFDLPVQVQVAWKQEMRNVKIALNLSEAPNLAFIGEKDPYSADQTGLVAYRGEVEVPFPVEENATEAVVTLLGDAGPLGGNDLDLFVRNPTGAMVYNKTLEDSYLEGIRGQKAVATEEVVLDQAKLLDGGTGEWVARITFPDGAPPQAAYTLAVRVYYNTSRSVESFVAVPHDMPAGSVANVTFRLRATAPGPVVVGVRSLGWAHYTHTDAQATDDGNFSKTQRMAFNVGTTFRVQAGGAGLVSVGFDPATKLMRQWGFLLGWLGFFLVPPALVLGGTFGGASVRALNRFAGTARQRVLWHNALSYIVLAVGLVHMVLFLVETTYHWTVGIVWGTLTLASMIGLGVTGALQTRIARSWGYATWRFTHFLLGMLVVVFIALHLVVDGVDFQFVRDYFA